MSKKLLTLVALSTIHLVTTPGKAKTADSAAVPPKIREIPAGSPFQHEDNDDLKALRRAGHVRDPEEGEKFGVDLDTLKSSGAFIGQSEGDGSDTLQNTVQDPTLIRDQADANQADTSLAPGAETANTSDPEPVAPKAAAKGSTAKAAGAKSADKDGKDLV